MNKIIDKDKKKILKFAFAAFFSGLFLGAFIFLKALVQAG